jgi:hypothetical protein
MHPSLNPTYTRPDPAPDPSVTRRTLGPGREPPCYIGHIHPSYNKQDATKGKERKGKGKEKERNVPCTKVPYLTTNHHMGHGHGHDVNVYVDSRCYIHVSAVMRVIDSLWKESFQTSTSTRFQVQVQVPVPPTAAAQRLRLVSSRLVLPRPRYPWTVRVYCSSRSTSGRHVEPVKQQEETATADEEPQPA